MNANIFSSELQFYGSTVPAGNEILSVAINFIIIIIVIIIKTNLLSDGH